MRQARCSASWTCCKPPKERPAFPFARGVRTRAAASTVFRRAGPCMIEPFEPARTRFAAMSAEEAVDAAGAVFRKLDLL